MPNHDNDYTPDDDCAQADRQPHVWGTFIHGPPTEGPSRRWSRAAFIQDSCSQAAVLLRRRNRFRLDIPRLEDSAPAGHAKVSLFQAMRVPPYVAGVRGVISTLLMSLGTSVDSKTNANHHSQRAMRGK
jgi:hypothetical protein